MLIALFTWNLLRESRPADRSHLVRIETTEIHRLANVAIGFGPWFSDFKNFNRREVESTPIEYRRHAFEQLAALLERRTTPGFESIMRRLQGQVRFRNSRFGNIADNFIRLTWIQGRHQLVRPNFSSTNGERVFLSKAGPYFT